MISLMTKYLTVVVIAFGADTAGISSVAVTVGL